MAQKVQIILEDDLDGSPADETIQFGLDGKNYEIDLNKSHAKKLREALGTFVGSARSAGRVTKGGKSAGGQKRIELGPSASEIRDWARSNGHEVPDRGRIPGEVRAAFDAAH